MKFYNPWPDKLEDDTKENLEKCAAQMFSVTLARIMPYGLDYPFVAASGNSVDERQSELPETAE